MNFYANHSAVKMAPLFDLSVSELNSGAVTIQPVAKNQILFDKGQTAKRLYRVITGQVALFSPLNGKVMEILNAGTFFGEESLFGGDHLFSAKTLNVGQVAILDPAHLDDLDNLMRLALRNMSDRHRRLMEEVSSFKSMPPLQRLASLILSLPAIHDGQTEMQLPWRKNVIAERIGVRSETLSRLLPGLQEHGAQCAGSRVVITDLAALERFVAEEQNQRRWRKPVAANED